MCCSVASPLGGRVLSRWQGLNEGPVDALTRRLLTEPTFVEGLTELASEEDLRQGQVRRRARGALREMWTKHGPVASVVWNALGNFLLQRFNVVVNPPEGVDLSALDAEHPLVFLFSHRSYLDAWVVRDALLRTGVAPMLTLAGANLNFFPLGPLVRRTGGLFIRRSTKGDPVYRYVLRAYLAHVLGAKRNLGWSIEGGRTRTGKLRPPRYGALRYVVDAVRDREEPEVYVLPVSVVYDQLGEVASMTAEALGVDKDPEGVRWLFRYARQLREEGGVARVDFGVPMPLRERLAELDADESARATAVERIALSVCHSINQVTPATATAVVTLVLLAAERALTQEEVQEELSPLLRYLAAHPHLPSAVRETLGAERGDDAWARTTLEQLVERGVLHRFDGGVEPVYHIAPDQHLVAAFYRNTVIHFLVVRAIGELANFLERERQGDVREAIWYRALELRELLKFEFFFSTRRDFQRELLLELEVVDPDWDISTDEDGRYTREVTRDYARRWLEIARPHLAHVVLRPFLDAYRVVADALAKWPADAEVDEARLLDKSLRLGKQRVLQKRLHSAESVTLQLFRNALSVLEHRGLMKGTGEEIRTEREAFAAHLGHLVRELDALARRQWTAL